MIKLNLFISQWRKKSFHNDMNYELWIIEWKDWLAASFELAIYGDGHCDGIRH